MKGNDDPYGLALSDDPFAACANVSRVFFPACAAPAPPGYILGNGCGPLMANASSSGFSVKVKYANPPSDSPRPGVAALRRGARA
ncbi:MAG: hypothetical protein ABWX88_02710 [Pseudoxanthomonas sp.]